MKKILSILFVLIAFIANAQDQNPLPSITVKKLIAPNTPVFYYNTADSALWVFKGETGWLRIATNSQLQKYYVPYDNGIKDVHLPHSLEALTLQLLDGYVPTGLESKGTHYWDTKHHTVSFILENGVTGQAFQEQHKYGKNTSGVFISNGSPVSMTSVAGSFMTFELTDLNNEESARNFIGIATQDIAINAFGYVTTGGAVRELNTFVWPEKSDLYVSTTTGVLTTSMPPSNKYVIKVGKVIRTHLTQGEIEVKSMIFPTIPELSKVNGTPLTTNGQIMVWDQTNGYFDFDYNIWPDLISNEAYSGSWNGIDSIAASKNAVYDKISTLESINYCAATMTVTTGTLNQGTVSDLCAVGGTDVIVQERVANPPFQIDFTFTGVIRLSGIKFYGRYNGGATHNVHVECYNYVSATWDYVGEFSSTTNKQWFAYNLNLPNNYLSGGNVQVRIIHQDTGINTHQMILDYINVNYGGGGGSGFITAGAVEFTPNGNISATNVQAAIQELDTEKENLSNKENTTVDNSTTKYPTVNLLKTYADTKAPASGSVNYIQNQNASAQSANMWIGGSVRLGNDLFFEGNGLSINSASGYGDMAFNYSGKPITFNFFNGTGSSIANISSLGAATFAATIQATTARLTNLTDGYLPYHISDASGLGNSPIYTDETNVKLVNANLSATSNGTNNLWSFSRQDGITGVPSLAITGYQGIGFNADNIIGFPLAYHVYINTDGHLGVGYSTGTEISNHTFSVNGGAYIDGNVGIGITPIQKLDVNGNIIAAYNGKIGFRYSADNANYYSYLRSATNSDIGPIVLGGGFESNGSSNEAIRLVTNNGSGSERTAISIFNSGQVKIPNLSGTGTRLTTASADGTLGVIADGTNGQVLQTNGSGGYSWVDQSGTTIDTLFTTIAISDETTSLTTGTSKVTFRMPISCTLTEVRASVTTASTGANLIFDINENGTSVLSTKLSIDATEKVSVTAASQPVISDSSILDYSEITIDIDQVGSTIAGTGAKIIIYYIKN